MWNTERRESLVMIDADGNDAATGAKKASEAQQPGAGKEARNNYPLKPSRNSSLINIMILDSGPSELG